MFVQLPNVTMHILTAFLHSMGKTLDVTPQSMYKEKYLLSLRSCLQSNSTYIKGRCAAQMKKTMVYNIDASFNSSGAILETQCDCGAGMGPDAHCKHVCIVLLALIDFSNTKSYIHQASCTSKLQTFHQAKKFKGSPQKASTLDLSTSEGPRAMRSLSDYDPRPEHLRKTTEYQHHFRNMCINMTPSSMPVLQLFPPANPYAIANDHDYLPLSPTDSLLKQMQITEISPAACESIERNTREQQGNKTWHTERMKRIQSSNFGRICKATDRTDFEKLAESLVNSKSVRSKSIDHGRKFEPVAVAKYEEVTGTQTAKCGIFVNVECPFLGSSPDRVVNDTLVEVKCPYTSKNSKITPSTVPFLTHKDGQLCLVETHDYMYQVHGQMLCSGLSACDFVVYTFEDFKIVKVVKNDHFVQSMCSKLQIFFDNYFKPALLQKHYYRYYDRYTFD